jgi:hypothetical protein
VRKRNKERKREKIVIKRRKRDLKEIEKRKREENIKIDRKGDRRKKKGER